jgi:predicted house-cleaning NTP pyrophosphatase (Maf/HAM1 superfamily)
LETLLISNLRSIDERTLVYFADNEQHIIEAYVECEEGIDRAGGFAIQVRHPFFIAYYFYLLMPVMNRVWVAR